jgi:hypothetical protein
MRAVKVRNAKLHLITLNTLDSWSKKWLMEVNLKKTKIMIFQKHNSKKQNLNLNFTIGNKPVDITNEYTYLGLKITQMPNSQLQPNI